MQRDKILIVFESKTSWWEYYEALNTMQCMFHSYSQPEGAIALKVQSGFIEASYDEYSNDRCS